MSTVVVPTHRFIVGFSESLRFVLAKCFDLSDVSTNTIGGDETLQRKMHDGVNTFGSYCGRLFVFRSDCSRRPS